MEQNSLYRRVWDEMLFAGMRANYFGELVSRYQHPLVRVDCDQTQADPIGLGGLEPEP